jgi:hypothetical protein
VRSVTMADQGCLHCAITATINDHFEAAGHMHGDALVIDAKEVFSALTQILAESLAVIDSDDLRTDVLTTVLLKVVREVNEIREAGAQDEVLTPS